MGLFKRKKSGHKAIAFVDYEYWFYSYNEKFEGLKPDLARWRAELEEKYNLAEIVVFGDFSPQNIQSELVNIRKTTNTIIETQNNNGFRTKDMTDFIMLDYIYQVAAEHPVFDTFILFTGDGHFQSVVKYLVQKLKKKVIIYAVNYTLSDSLAQAASEKELLPSLEEYYCPVIEMIFM